MNKQLFEQLQMAGLHTLGSSGLIGRQFRFSNSRCTIGGIITGLSTTDDGLPFLEVSNRKFSGLEIEGILVAEKQGAKFTYDVGATLITTSPMQSDHWIKGTLGLLNLCN